MGVSKLDFADFCIVTTRECALSSPALPAVLNLLAKHKHSNMNGASPSCMRHSNRIDVLCDHCVEAVPTDTSDEEQVASFTEECGSRNQA